MANNASQRTSTGNGDGILVEVSEISAKLNDLSERCQRIEVQELIVNLFLAAKEVHECSSRSWYGYQARLYYGNFRKPPEDAYFDKDKGTTASIGPSGRIRRWVEYELVRVFGEIEDLAGKPDLKALISLFEEADKAFTDEKTNLLSIVDIAWRETSSDLILQLRVKLETLVITSEADFVQQHRPEPPYETNDRRARSEGIVVPPHIEYYAWLQHVRDVLVKVQELAILAHQIESHLARLHRRPQSRVAVGDRVFIGHGHSLVWWELKDFLENGLGLPVDEFNRVPTAGTAISERLSEMMVAAGIAFLVMTGEDEQPDGKVRARENVVHESGLFQGHLGFQRAIVLLEDGCEKFSNNTGLVHIPFPKGKIGAAFDEVRRVLEREGFLDGNRG